MKAMTMSTAFCGKTAELRARAPSTSAVRAPVVVRAQKEEAAVPRRAALGMIAGAAALIGRTGASQAAYGEAANVFGRATNTTGFIPYSGEGFALLLPARWNPSKEKDFNGVVVRYEDNQEAVNNLVVIKRPTTKSSIKDFGSPDAFLAENVNLLGDQVWIGDTKSEGGFKEGKVSAASVLGVSEATDKKGKPYYRFSVLTRTADGDEGGRHHLITAAVGNGNLYILKVQVGDKRWFKGVNKDAEGSQNSFVVA